MIRKRLVVGARLCLLGMALSVIGCGQDIGEAAPYSSSDPTMDAMTQDPDSEVPSHSSSASTPQTSPEEPGSPSIALLDVAGGYNPEGYPKQIGDHRLLDAELVNETGMLCEPVAKEDSWFDYVTYLNDEGVENWRSYDGGCDWVRAYESEDDQHFPGVIELTVFIEDPENQASVGTECSGALGDPQYRICYHRPWVDILISGEASAKTSTPTQAEKDELDHYLERFVNTVSSDGSVVDYLYQP